MESPSTQVTSIHSNPTGNEDDFDIIYRILILLIKVKVKEIFIIPWGQFCFAASSKPKKKKKRKTAQQTIKTATNKTTTMDKSAGRYNNHFIKLFRSPVATGTNEFFSLFVLHLGTTYLLPEGSRMNSLKSSGHPVQHGLSSRS